METKMGADKMMFQKNWEAYFSPGILAHGKIYFKNSQVQNIRVRENTIFADVYDREPYSVKIIMQECLQKMSCTCPYASHGKYCKHMAAVCFALENHPAFPLNQKPINTLLEDAPYADVLAFVRNLITEDENAASQFRLWIEPDVKTASLKYYGAELTCLIKNLSDGYAESWDEEFFQNAVDRLENFYDLIVPILRTRKKVRSIFTLANDAVDSYLECLSDNDTFSDLGRYVLKPLFDALDEVLVYADKELMDEMYTWAKEHAKNDELKTLARPLIKQYK